MNTKWLTTIGLIFDIIGSGILIIRTIRETKEQSIDIGGTYLMSKIPEENLDIPAIKERIIQRKYTFWGFLGSADYFV